MATSDTNGTRRKLRNRLESLRSLRKKEKKLKAEISSRQDECLGFMDELEQKSFSYTDPDGIRVIGTKVEPVRDEFNEARLKKQLGLKLWNRVSVRRLDKSKLEEALQAGLIDPVVVAECMSQTELGRYVKISEEKE